MKSVVVQFHGKTSELLEFVRQVRAELSLYTALMTLSPFRIKQIASDDELDIAAINDFRRNSDLRLALNLSEANVNVASPNEFLDANPGTIVLDFGSEATDVLGESALMFRSDVKPAIKVAQEVAKRLKRVTKSGVVAVNPDSGAECLDKSHRFTRGAEEHFQEGKILMPIAGKSILKIPQSAAQTRRENLGKI